jgi:hypothetical protein
MLSLGLSLGYPTNHSSGMLGTNNEAEAING